MDAFSILAAAGAEVRVRRDKLWALVSAKLPSGAMIYGMCRPSRPHITKKLDDFVRTWKELQSPGQNR